MPLKEKLHTPMVRLLGKALVELLKAKRLAAK